MVFRKMLMLAFVVFAMILTSAAQTKGNATYYSNRLHGNRVSDGTRYHRDSMTCAHKTYPFGTILRVRNVRNGNEVYVKVTDRGPFRKGCIVDLSYAAATQLDMIAAGVVPVEVEKVEPVISVREIENATLPTLDLKNLKGTDYFSLALNKMNMEKQLKEKTDKIAIVDIKLENNTTHSQEVPRYKIYRDRLSAQSK